MSISLSGVSILIGMKSIENVIGVFAFWAGALTLCIAIANWLNYE